MRVYATLITSTRRRKILRFILAIQDPVREEMGCTDLEIYAGTGFVGVAELELAIVRRRQANTKFQGHAYRV